MPTAAIPGRKAYLRSSSSSTASTGQTLMAELQDYTLTVEATDIDVTNHDSSGWHEGIIGIKSWSVEASANYLSTAAGQGALRASMIDSDANVYVTLQATTATNAKKYQGKVRILSFTQANPTGGQIVGTFRLMGTGAIVRTA